jgi:hypothetical protein
MNKIFGFGKILAKKEISLLLRVRIVFFILFGYDNRCNSMFIQYFEVQQNEENKYFKIILSVSKQKQLIQFTWG